MHIPGFTAETTLCGTSRSYRAMGASPTVLGSGALTLALDNDPKLGYIDCKDFPDNITCRECGNTGPGSVICCPNDYCIVNNPPQQVGIKNLAKGVLAYEPVWAIGTGEAASPEHAQAILHFLRGYLILKDPEVGENMRILYGGSLKAHNAATLFNMPDIDGGLVGGASLITEEFVEICRAVSSS